MCHRCLQSLSADTSFMYMIAGLCMLKLYQKRHPDINASAYTAYACLAAVIFFSVLGVVRTHTHTHTDRIIVRPWVKFKHVPKHTWTFSEVCDGLSAGIWERKHGLLDRFLSDPHPGHSPPQHTALLHGPVEVR